MIAGSDGRRERGGEGDWAKEKSGLIVTAAAAERAGSRWGGVCPGDEEARRARQKKAEGYLSAQPASPSVPTSGPPSCVSLCDSKRNLSPPLSLLVPTFLLSPL